MTTSLSPTSNKSNVLPNGLRVQIATFNCNLQGTASSQPDLTSWLIPTLSPNLQTHIQQRDPPDIYAIGFQELLPLDVGFSSSTLASDAISKTDTQIRQTLRPHSALTLSDNGKYPIGGGPENYTLLGKSSMVGLVVYVYGRERSKDQAKVSLVSRVKEVRIGNAGTGLVGLMGNKGAVGVRIVLKGEDIIGKSAEGTSLSPPDEVLTFACAHLAAHDHMVKRRNLDWKNIVQRLVFSKDSVKALPPVQSNPNGSGGGGPADLASLTEKYEKEGVSKETSDSTAKKDVAPSKALDSNDYSVYDTTHLFIFGDLNYRIAFNTSPQSSLLRKGASQDKLKKVDIKRKINQQDFKTLAAYDQLSIERLAEPSRVFQGLTEPPLSECGFGPTYKFKVMREGKEKDQDGKQINPLELSGKRVPGWTDRILFNGRIGDGIDGIKVELYRSIMSYTVSMTILVRHTS